jgi:hypothetical protein
LSILIGVLLIAANVVLHFMGLSASYNVGNPEKFEFLLISFWHIGAALLCIGAVLFLIGRQPR